MAHGALAERRARTTARGCLPRAHHPRSLGQSSRATERARTSVVLPAAELARRVVRRAGARRALTRSRAPDRRRDQDVIGWRVKTYGAGDAATRRERTDL